MNSLIEIQSIVKVEVHMLSGGHFRHVITTESGEHEVSAEEFKRLFAAVRDEPDLRLARTRCLGLGHAYQVVPVVRRPVVAPEPFCCDAQDEPEVEVSLEDALWLERQEKASRIRLERRRSPELIRLALERKAAREADGDELAEELFPEPEPEPQHPAYALAARGAEACPELASRMEKGAELVAEGKVMIHGENEYGVIGTVRGYSITARGCTCADFEYRGGWCKHRLAVRMAMKLGMGESAVPDTCDAAIRARKERERLARKAKVAADSSRDRQEWDRYCRSGYGTRRYLLAVQANGGTVRPEIMRRAKDHRIV